MLRLRLVRALKNIRARLTGICATIAAAAAGADSRLLFSEDS